MNSNKAPKRAKTAIHRKIIILRKQFPNSIEGLDECQLMNPNCPKKVTVDRKILQKEFVIKEENNSKWLLSKKDLSLFFLKKYNLFYKEFVDPTTQEQSTLTFSFQNGSLFKKDYLEEVNSEEYLEKFYTIEKLVLQCFLEQPDWFSGLKKKHFQQNINPPNKITIEKNSIRDVCKFVTKIENPPEEIISSGLQKMQRAMSLFFKARFNLVNNTKMNRKYLTYTQNFPKRKHKQNTSRKRSRKRNTKTNTKKKTKTNLKSKDHQLKNSNSILNPKKDRGTLVSPTKRITNPQRMTKSDSNLKQNNKSTPTEKILQIKNFSKNVQLTDCLKHTKAPKKINKKFKNINNQFIHKRLNGQIEKSNHGGDDHENLECFERSSLNNAHLIDNNCSGMISAKIEKHETEIKEDLQMLKELLDLKKSISEID
ncbi:hypothetical protein M0812_06687 [Anaeramoeba flamelloides]|uniref:Uncharacterized protein n=1 Tax=Anaeramoeba flamelloides TaxID=1746091 RepID=A0AAV8AC49_9EUKA|nr:hypothetical protein M0812_06687 [Anaeramoeba flamelloides]